MGRDDLREGGLASILDSLPDGVCLVDLGLVVERLNPAAMALLRLTPEAVGASFPSLVSLSPLDRDLASAVAAGATIRVEDGRATCRDGTFFLTVPVSFTIAPVVRNGVVSGAVISMCDISDRKRAEEEAREARVAAEVAVRSEHAKDEFLTNMSHELRTPLNAIIGYAEILAEEMPESGADQLVPDAQKIRSAGRHLLRLINNILDLSKIEAGRMEAHIENIDVADLVVDVTTTVRQLIEANANRFDVRVEPDVGTIDTDVVKLSQCLFNLLSNAGKFTQDGVVTLTVVRDAATIRFDVSDTGIGLTDEQIGSLFRPFVQAESSTTRRFGGTGLGLVLSRRFAQLLGGDIDVESAPGSGSRFTLSIPIASDARTDLGRVPDGRVVLVVDDDPNARDLLCRFLARDGYAAVPLASADDLVGVCRRVRPVAITLDVTRRGLDCWSALAQLKADPETADVPVMLVTLDDQRARGLALGATACLSKPIDRACLQSLRKRLRGVTRGLPASATG